MISVAHPKMHKNTAAKIELASMYGLLRPHRDFEASDTAPTMGCTIRPDNGGAIHTNEVWLLARPSCSRRGVKSWSRVS